MNEWQPIETAPKDGRHVVLGVSYGRNGHPRVCVAYWKQDRYRPWIMMDENTQVRGDWRDSSRWVQAFSEDDAISEINDEDEGHSVRHFDATHWMPLPEPPK